MGIYLLICYLFLNFLSIFHNTQTITIAVQIVQDQHQQHWYLYQLAQMLGRIDQFFTLLLFHLNLLLMLSSLLSLYFLVYARKVAGVFSWLLLLPPSCNRSGNILLIDRRSKLRQVGLCPRYIWRWRLCIRGKLSWSVPISECRCSKKYDWIIQKSTRIGLGLDRQRHPNRWSSEDGDW